MELDPKCAKPDGCWKLIVSPRTQFTDGSRVTVLNQSTPAPEPDTPVEADEPVMWLFDEPEIPPDDKPFKWDDEMFDFPDKPDPDDTTGTAGVPEPPAANPAYIRTQRQRAKSKHHLLCHGDFNLERPCCQAKARNKRHAERVFIRE